MTSHLYQCLPTDGLFLFTWTRQGLERQFIITGPVLLQPPTPEGKEIKYGTTRDRTQATGLASNPSIHRTVVKVKASEAAFNFLIRFHR